MQKKNASVKKQSASTDAAAIVEENTNNAHAMEATEPTATEQEILLDLSQFNCEFSEADDTFKGLKVGDHFRLAADMDNETAFFDLRPLDDHRNPDKPNSWNAATREAYKGIMRACIGLKVNFTFTDDRRATIIETATITGCGMDTTNDRATFTLSSGRKVASGYTFKAIGYDSDRTARTRNTDTTEANDNRTAAEIRQDITATEAKRDKLNARIEALNKALTKAIESDLAIITEALKAHPTDRRTLAAVIATPTANRIPTEEAEGLLAAMKAVEGIPAAAAAVRLTMETAHGESAVYLMGCDPAAIAAADEVAAVMKAHQVQLGDIPTDILS